MMVCVDPSQYRNYNNNIINTSMNNCGNIDSSTNNGSNSATTLSAAGEFIRSAGCTIKANTNGVSQEICLSELPSNWRVAVGFNAYEGILESSNLLAFIGSFSRVFSIS